MSVFLCFLCFIAAPFVWCGILMAVLFVLHRFTSFLQDPK